MLILTLPSIHRTELMERIISEPFVHGVRYNTGKASVYSPEETLKKAFEMANKYNKKFWVDLKGRQLRVEHWALPDYGKITLNHNIEVELPAKVYFRGDSWTELKAVEDNVIYVDPPPKYAVGEGQSVNIVAKNLVVSGNQYLTLNDMEYIETAVGLGIKNFMLSFVERETDIYEVQNFLHIEYKGLKDFECVLKIESLKGVEFVEKFDRQKTKEEFLQKLVLMAARDDLFNQIGENKTDIFSALQKIILADENAILASRIFSSLEMNDEPSLADFSDLFLMKRMGYKNFLLSDEICERHFEKAITAWRSFNLSDFNPSYKILREG